MVIPAENIETALSQFTQKPRERLFGINEAVLKAVPRIRQRIQQLERRIPEKTKLLVHGKLTYSAESLPDGEIIVPIKILSPTCPEQSLEIKLSNKDFNSLESFGLLMRTKIIDFISKNFSENNGLENYDIGRIDEMAEDIFKTFCD